MVCNIEPIYFKKRFQNLNFFQTKITVDKQELDLHAVYFLVR